MELERIYRGMPDGAEVINKNFSSIVKAMNRPTSASGNQEFGFGITGNLTRVGNLVITTCLATQTSPQRNGSKDLLETIPAGYRPAYRLSVKSYVYVGSAYQDTRHHRLLFKTDGHITAITNNMDAAPLEIAFNVVWVTNDPMPSDA